MQEWQLCGTWEAGLASRGNQMRRGLEGPAVRLCMQEPRCSATAFEHVVTENTWCACPVAMPKKLSVMAVRTLTGNSVVESLN